MPLPKEKDENITSKTKGKPNSVDGYVGSRLRLRRTLLGYSQEKLADALGITFQQVQKYERGTNRISASRLYKLSQILEVSVTYFFDEYGSSKFNQDDGAVIASLSDGEQDEFNHSDILNKKETIELVRTYYSIKNPKIRKDLMKLIKTMTENMKEE